MVPRLCYNRGMPTDLKGYRAAVTGASGGIGAALAAEAARLGADVVLIARRRSQLQEVADRLQTQFRVTATVVVADLSDPDQRRRAWHEATAGGPVHMLVNNAGFGHHRPFATVPPQRDRDLLELNIHAVVELTHWFIDHVSDVDRERTMRAYLLNVASIAAYQPVPNMATYAASKAFVHQWSTALHMELASRNIMVCALNPGGTRTDFHRMAGAGRYGAIADLSMLNAERVAAIGVRALLRGQPDVVPGLLNKVSCFMVRLAPRKLVAWAAGWVLGTPKTDELPPTTR